ncbi:MAG: glycosyltransferase family 2 protein, partial [Gorillibacterium sp.]|nr:glycosyltransferase family 2 protein [Gorillibacterium sp.]
MIVKNEADIIGRCLNSVCDVVDEIIIVDTGSTDVTKSIVQKYTQQIYDFVWVDDFAAARNYAFNQASKDYIFWLDADDIMTDNERSKFAALKDTLDPSVDSVTMSYHLAFDEFGEVTSSLRRNRLVKRINKFQWVSPVHEYLEVWGSIVNSDIAVTHSSLHHDNERNLLIYEKRLNLGEEFSPRDLYYYANELIDHRRYKDAISFYEKFLATGKGWVEDNISA